MLRYFCLFPFRHLQIGLYCKKWIENTLFRTRNQREMHKNYWLQTSVNKWSLVNSGGTRFDETYGFCASNYSVLTRANCNATHLGGNAARIVSKHTKNFPNLWMSLLFSLMHMKPIYNKYSTFNSVDFRKHFQLFVLCKSSWLMN